MYKNICIIAEAGDNHNGIPELAFQLVDKAVEAGADFIKFQTFKTEEVIARSAPQAEYQKKNTGITESQFDMVKKLELPSEVFFELAEYSRCNGIGFLSTPFDFPSIDLLCRIGLDLFKVSSGEITNLPFLRKIGSLGKKIILSTGMSTLDEVRAALDVLVQCGTACSDITLLHCTTEYPAPFAEVNLRAMQTMREAFPEIAGIGYSDHTKGIAIPLAAAALGACVIEKHFTLDCNMEGPDHKASLEPHELAAMVQGIRQIESAMGDGQKKPTQSEIPNMLVARKSIVAACSIKSGEVFTGHNLTTKRPGSGISPMMWDSIIGTVASKDYSEDDIL